MSGPDLNSKHSYDSDTCLFMNLYSVPNSQSTGPSLPLKVPRVLFPRVSCGHLLFYIFLVTVIPKANKSGEKERR